MESFLDKLARATGYDVSMFNAALSSRADHSLSRELQRQNAEDHATMVAMYAKHVAALSRTDTKEG